MTDGFDALYARALERAAHARGYVFCGFTSDLDKLIKWDAGRLEKCAAQYECAVPRSPITYVRTPGELISGMLWYCRSGTGGELDIRDESLCDFIDERFGCEDAIGGTGIQAACALAAAGIEALCHPSDSSREVLNLLTWPRLKMLDGGIAVAASEARPSGLNPMRHYILQFDKGDRLLAGGESFVIPSSNRIIITFDTLNEDLVIDRAYIDYIKTNSDNCTSALFSGLNCVTPLERLIRRADELGDIALSLSMPVYLEDAHYHEFAYHAEVYRRLAPKLDIMGMNEDEFACALLAFGLPSPASKAEFINSAMKLRDLLATRKGLVVHTRDFAMYAGDHAGLTPDMALCLGNIMGTTRARLGRYGSYDDLAETAELPLSEEGLKWAEAAKGIGDVTLIPSRTLDKPVCTVGLGDCFTAGVQALLRE